MKKLATLGLALGLAACGNPPATINAPSDSNMITVIQDPLFSRLDGASLVDLAAYYPAHPGRHTIPLGDYIGSRLVRELTGREAIERLSVPEFVVECLSVGTLFPRVICDGAAVLEVTTQSRIAAYEAMVSDRDVGLTYGRSRGESSPIDAIILDQVMPVVDDLINALVAQVP